MPQYEWTLKEQQAIEKAAGRLKHVMTDADAEDAAYDIAQDIRESIIMAVLERTRTGK